MDERSNVSADSQKAYRELVAWVEQEGGFVDPRLGVVHRQGLQGIGPETESLEVGTVVMKIPGNVILAHEDDCDFVQHLAHEIRLREQSDIYPFLQILLPQLDAHRLPAFWSAAARRELQGLPPQADAYRHVGWYQQTCLKMKGGHPDNWSQAQIQALLLVVTYASSAGLPPVYHLMNHHRGLINTKIVVSDDQAFLEVHVTRAVTSEEQLYMDYVRPTSADYFRDYGFVEHWPRRWSWTWEPRASTWAETLWNLVQNPASWVDNTPNSPQTFTLEIWPDEVVAIQPPPITTTFSGSQPIRTLWESQQEARQHTESLSVNQLQDFRHGALHLLNETLPTTWMEDEALLAMRQNGDVEKAIAYRLEFKRNVDTAIHVVNRILEQRLQREANMEATQEL